MTAFPERIYVLRPMRLYRFRTPVSMTPDEADFDGSSSLAAAKGVDDAAGESLPRFSIKLCPHIIDGNSISDGFGFKWELPWFVKGQGDIAFIKQSEEHDISVSTSSANLYYTIHEAWYETWSQKPILPTGCCS
ncbi:uncharacterized protein MCYG_01335 [Microsporum canis CBS 113480]|uniref:Uncharacterized protein n=1 Tax=Arthroderma otae (strain ATCC MYA-4605 / CBS 113480) TaxID=554155 RepID=C5FF63_ARTOC|nr:uncharacterized protein MCYG_01335 [Microsporum canis CBS 113480]EEQ28447.1 predicted protein [Microsporum canis CBS 113480]